MCYYFIVKISDLKGGYIMENKNCKASGFKLILVLISVVAALSAAITAFFVVKEKKKKDEEELEEYLDYSIQ